MPDDSIKVRVRFAPSPTGYLHIGGARTVLFNWLVARGAGGTFVLRIEDTDRTRHVEDSVAKILDDLRWLGLAWDEGPEAGGDVGPYFQSQRLDLYERHLRRLLDSGHAYYAMETPEELAAMREKAERATGGFRYPRPDPLPTVEQGEKARREGRRVVVRFKMPGEDITIVDDILGPVTLAADQMDDFVIQKSDGFPTYHFACVVDDELMKITHVLRGQEHLMNTPKHVAMQRALGFSTPHYGHMPVIFNMNGSKMSKRDKEKAIKRGEPPPEIDVHDFRKAGYLSEAIVNFISLLGWNPGDDRDQFDLTELTGLFSVERIGKTNARFDRDKLIAFNTDWAARLPKDRLLAAFKDFLRLNPHVPAQMRPAGADSFGEKPALPEGATSRGLGPARSGASDDVLAAVLQACEGFRVFTDVVKKAGFLFVDDDAIEYDLKAVKKVLAKGEGAGYAMLEYLVPKLRELSDWSTESIEELVKQVCDEKDVKMGAVAQPLRVAVSGTTISPTIGETLTLLGQDRTLARIGRCLAMKP